MLPRRTFLRRAAAMAAVLGLDPTRLLHATPPPAAASLKPGERFKGGHMLATWNHGLVSNAEGWRQMQNGGSALDAVVEGTNSDGRYAGIEEGPFEVPLKPEAEVVSRLGLEVRGKGEQQKQTEVDQRPGGHSGLERNAPHEAQPDGPPQGGGHGGQEPPGPKDRPHVSHSS